MHDLTTLKMGCGGWFFLLSPPNPAQIIPESLIRVSVHCFGAKRQGWAPNCTKQWI